MSVLFYDGVDHMIEKITTLIKGKANNSHKHTKNDITDFPTLGTASSKDVASSGNASATQVVMGNDTRLSDARKASDVYAWAKASSKPSYTKSEIGLGNVDNTSDSSKPVSTAQQTAIDTAYDNANKYTDKKVADLIGSAPETMDTLEEVAAAIQENKDVETALNEAIGKKANQTELDTHTGNSTIHITASERTNWNAAKTHADSTHARTDATKVEKSSTNGNIKINGTETTVYTHPSGTNPHGTTKSDVGLGNVGNFKAVSTVASQGLTDAEKSNARANIGAGTSSFSGSYNDLSNKPTIPTKVGELTNDKDYATKTEVTEAIDSIEIGGRNLLLNSNFELPGKPNWSSLSEYVCITNEGRNGGYCIKQIGEFNKDHGAINIVGDKYYKIKVKANDILTFSGWYKVQNYVAGTTNNYVRPYVSYYKSDDSWVSETGIIDVISPDATDWTYVQATFKVPNISTIDYMVFTLYARDYTGIIWWDDIKLEKGNKATPWTPAPEDTEAEIQKVDNKLTTNLLKPTLGTTTKNDVTCTNNGDGTYTLSGTASSDTPFVLGYVNVEIGKKYRLCCTKSADKSKYSAYMEKGLIGYEYTTIIATSTVANATVQVKANTPVDNVVIKPMLTTNLNATYDDFVPYTGSTGQINSDVADIQSALDGKAASSHTHTKSEVGLGNVDNTSDANKSVKYATSAGSANSAIKASGVADYNKTSNYIKVGYDGSGITGDEIRYIAGYTTGDSNSAARIKDVSKDALKSWLGLGSLAYSSATIPTIPSSLPANGGNSTTVNGHTVNADVPSGAKFTDTTYTSKSAVSGGKDVSLVTTGEKATWNAKTSNAGTITGIKMNGASKGTSGVVDLGTVLTGGSQTSTSDEDGGENVYTFSDGSTITIKNGTKGDAGTGGSNRLTYYETRPTSANKASSSDRVGSIEAFVASSKMTTGKPSADAKILQMNWDNTSGWDSQLAMINSGTLQHRNMSNGKWQNWKTVLDSSNYSEQIGFETGIWTPILFDTSSHEVIKAQGVAFGNYYKLKDIVFIEAIISTTSSYACHHIGGLPYEPDHERPSNMYPIGIVSGDNGTNSPFNLISGSNSYYVQNGAYLSAKTCNNWYVYGWYEKKAQ